MQISYATFVQNNHEELKENKILFIYVIKSKRTILTYYKYNFSMRHIHMDKNS